jgi:MATE family multidrug resistance protein
MLEFLETIVVIYFIGQKYDDLTQASVGLATITQNCLAYAITYSVSTGLEAMASQAYGNKTHELVGIYLQKSLIMIGILFIPILLAFYFIDIILVEIGME